MCEPSQVRNRQNQDHRSRIGDVRVEQFDPERGSLENMIEYFMKGAEAIGMRLRSDAYEVLPR